MSEEQAMREAAAKAVRYEIAYAGKTAESALRRVLDAIEALPLPAQPDPDVEAMAAEHSRLLDHFETWARDHSTDATAETWAIIYCSRAALADDKETGQ